MDFIDGLPPSQGYIVIMVIVDHLSKYTYFINLKHSYTALIVTKVFIAQIVRFHWTPTSIVSDRETVFYPFILEGFVSRNYTIDKLTDKQKLLMESQNSMGAFGIEVGQL